VNPRGISGHLAPFPVTLNGLPVGFRPVGMKSKPDRFETTNTSLRIPIVGDLNSSPSDVTIGRVSRGMPSALGHSKGPDPVKRKWALTASVSLANPTRSGWYGSAPLAKSP